MGKPLRLLNLALGLVAVLIAAALAKTWVSPDASMPILSATKPSQEAAAVAFARPERPPLAHFDLLLEKNPFKQPPPPPPPRPASHRVAPSPPPPPLPTLVGTILVDHERRAILSDKGKGDIYSIGQQVAGGTLTAISEDRVLYKRGDTVSELTLKAPIQPGAPAHQPAPSVPPGGSPPSLPLSSPPVFPYPPTPLPPQAIEGAPTTPGGALSRTQRRRLRLLRQQGQVEPPQEQQEQ